MIKMKKKSVDCFVPQKYISGYVSLFYWMKKQASIKESDNDTVRASIRPDTLTWACGISPACSS
jgi:hypothetical protein